MMGIKLNKKVLGLGAALMGMVFGSAAANAGAMLILTDGTNTVTVSDNGAGDIWGSGSGFDYDGLGVITYAGVVGDWNLNVTTGNTKPFSGSATMGHMHLDSIDATNSSGGTLWVILTDTDFVAGNANTYFNMNFGGITAGTVQMTGCVHDDNSNIADETDCGTAIGTSGTLSDAAFSWAGSGSAATDGLFAMGIMVEINHTGSGTSSIDAELQVPEPGILGLFGFGLLGMGIAARRRRMI